MNRQENVRENYINWFCIYSMNKSQFCIMNSSPEVLFLHLITEVGCIQVKSKSRSMTM